MKKRSHFFILVFILFVGAIIGARILPRIIYPVKYISLVEKYAIEYQVDFMLVESIMKIESNFNPNAKSPKGACGLMQIMPETGFWIAEKLNIENFSEDDLFNPEISIRFGTWNIAYLLRYFDGELHVAIAAYNAGMGNVSNWLDKGIWSGLVEDSKNIPFKETSKYVVSVDKAYENYKKIYSTMSIMFSQEETE